jgi:hypothetical protein
MSGAIPRSPNTPSWRGAQLKRSTGTTLTHTTNWNKKLLIYYDCYIMRHIPIDKPSTRWIGLYIPVSICPIINRRGAAQWLFDVLNCNIYRFCSIYKCNGLLATRSGNGDNGTKGFLYVRFFSPEDNYFRFSWVYFLIIFNLLIMWFNC